MDKKPKLLDLVRLRLRLLHKSLHTERQYLAWITQYISFCNRHEPDKSKWRHPKDCGRHEIEAFLTYLAVDRPCGGFHPKSSLERPGVPLPRNLRPAL